MVYKVLILTRQRVHSIDISWITFTMLTFTRQNNDITLLLTLPGQIVQSIETIWTENSQIEYTSYRHHLHRKSTTFPAQNIKIYVYIKQVTHQIIQKTQILKLLDLQNIKFCQASTGLRFSECIKAESNISRFLIPLCMGALKVLQYYISVHSMINKVFHLKSPFSSYHYC